MQQRTIGNDAVGRFEIGAIGMGFMPMSWPAAKDAQRIDATVRAGLDDGVTFLDTADSYGADGRNSTGENEELLSASVDRLGIRGQIVIATKGGSTRTNDGGWELDGSPAHLRAAADASLARLGVDVIDLYQFHRPDPYVDYADSLGALAKLHAAGKVRTLGISNADLTQIRQAKDILGEALVSVQNQFAPNFLTSRPELALCDELGLAFLPWSPLGGIGQAGELVGSYAPFAEVAAEVGVSAQRVCLAWMLALSPMVVPIPGASRPETIVDSAAAADVVLSADQLARLSAGSAAS